MKTKTEEDRDDQAFNEWKNWKEREKERRLQEMKTKTEEDIDDQGCKKWKNWKERDKKGRPH